MDKPRIFPGSSGKQEKLLQALTRGLEEVAHAVSARKAGVYLRADPGDMKTLDGHDNGQRAKLIAKQLRRSGQRSAQIASWGAHLLESGRVHPCGRLTVPGIYFRSSPGRVFICCSSAETFSSSAGGRGTRPFAAR
jgi:hypothetical protein